MANKEIKLDVIPGVPPHVTILKPKDEFSFVFTGRGNRDYLCGKCGAILVKSVNEGQIKGMVIQCNKCRSYNSV